MGGGGGGFAGAPEGAGDENEALHGDTDGVVSAGDWTQAGGLSLAIAIPATGQKLTFSKPGGDAKLALGFRPRASLEAILGLVWTAVWLVVALGLIAALGQADAFAKIRRWLPITLALGGLVWYFALPYGNSGFGLFVVGLAALAWKNRRAV